MRKVMSTSAWLKWCVEVGELVEQRDNLVGHPHSLGEKWETNLIRYYQDQIDDLRAHEPDRYRVIG
jgi:hypothetical protein